MENLLRSVLKSRRLESANVSLLIDEAWYLRTYPDVSRSGMSAIQHYLSVGWAEGRNPGPLFDTEWYFLQSPDVEESGLNPLTHYMQTGWREGRSPHPLFDGNFYLSKNPDVMLAGINPLVHFLSRGQSELRDPHPLFSVAHYLNQGPKLAPGQSALDHYVSEGEALGLSPGALFDAAWYGEQAGAPRHNNRLQHYAAAVRSNPELSPHPLFDAAWYLETNPDVRAAGINPLYHFMEQGWKEQRAPHPLFDVVSYQANVTESLGLDSLTHYLTIGWKEGIRPHPLFDSPFYAGQLKDVRAKSMEPLGHYLRVGWKAGLFPNPMFSPNWYLKAYPDIARSGREPLTHFVLAGSNERRRPSSDFHTDWYAQTYPEAAASGLNLLLHYLEIGAAKRYKPNALAGAAAGPSASDAAKPPVVTPSPSVNKRAGMLVAAPLDGKGQPSYPNFRNGDGLRLSAFRLDRDHAWLSNRPLVHFLEGLDDRPLLPNGIRRILIIGHDFTQKTGVMRSLSHYLNALTAAGGFEITSLQLAPGTDALAAWNDAEVHDLVIVNSLPLLFEHENGIEFMRRCGPAKAAVYLHETDFVFNTLEEKLPKEYRAFADAAHEFNFLTVSGDQERMLRERFGAKRVFRVHETSPVDLPKPPARSTRLDADSALKIVMAGTLQARKGVTLFSKLADLAAEQGLNWKFRWAGGEVGRSEGLYRSANVDFVGNLNAAEMLDFVTSADVFCLSSEDDPFPLACLEALQMMKRVVVYKGTGTAEAIRSLSGCAVYDSHEPEAALKALKSAIGSQLDEQAYAKINAQYSLGGFVGSMREAVSSFHQPPAHKAPDWVPAQLQRIAAIVHLGRSNQWNEIASHLEGMRHRAPDIYITLTTDLSPVELQSANAAILRRWPEATILELPNRGADFGAFAEVARHINTKGLAYDLIAKITSSTDCGVSDAAPGEPARSELLEDLLGTPGNIDRIVATLSMHPEIGMVIRSEPDDRDSKRHVNEEVMRALGCRMGLTEFTTEFFHASTFWGRAEDLLNPIVKSGITIEDFEAGPETDQPTARAMEHLFACMIRLAGKKALRHDRHLPKPVRLLKDKHKGEDIYIIAAGASVGLIDPAFFKDKTTIGVNRVFVRFPCTYATLKEYANADYERQLVESGAIPVISQWDSGNIRQAKMRRNLMLFKRPEYYFYEHLENTREIVDLSVIASESDSLVVSYSTITSAMHLAAYMGARNIILVGHDCGLLDGKAVFDGYYKDTSVSAWDSAKEYTAWLNQIEDQTMAVRDKVKAVFGVEVISLNPFINIGLEGHSYARASDDAQGALAKVSSNRGKPAMLLCNGPSVKNMNVPDGLDKYIIARMNFFFLEPEPFAGGRVDHLFWSLNEPTFHAELEAIVRSGRYRISQFNCPVPYERLKYSKGLVSERPFFDAANFTDYWKVIARRPSLAKAMMSRPMPTTGVQAFASLAVLGHREISIAGMDFYDSPNRRYHYEVPQHIATKLDAKHLTPGYEPGAHSSKTDMDFMIQVFREFPSLKLRLLSDMPVLKQFLTANSIPHTSEIR